MIQISLHAYDRAKQRYGLSEKSFKRLAEKAYDLGKRQTDLKGKLKKYVCYLAKEYKSVPVLYGTFLYFFKNDRLITTYQLPQEYIKYLHLL